MLPFNESLICTRAHAKNSSVLIVRNERNYENLLMFNKLTHSFSLRNEIVKHEKKRKIKELVSIGILSTEYYISRNQVILNESSTFAGNT